MITTYQATVEPDWIDYNGHLNVAYYVLLFDRALDEALASFGIGPEYRQHQGCSVFVGEHHVVYDREVLARAHIRIDSRVLAVDDRRLVAFQEMRVPDTDDRRPVATCETLSIHVDLTIRRAVPWPPATRERLFASRTEASKWPARAGRAIRIARSD